MKVVIDVPEVVGAASEIKSFIDAMVYKLTKNAHKGKWENISLVQTLKRLDEERKELVEAIKGGNTIEIILEAADVANFALIAASIAVRDAADETRIREGSKTGPIHGRTDSDGVRKEFDRENFPLT